MKHILYSGGSWETTASFIISCPSPYSLFTFIVGARSFLIFKTSVKHDKTNNTCDEECHPHHYTWCPLAILSDLSLSKIIRSIFQQVGPWTNQFWDIVYKSLHIQSGRVLYCLLHSIDFVFAGVLALSWRSTWAIKTVWCTIAHDLKSACTSKYCC